MEKRVFERFSARFPAKFKDARDEFGYQLNLRDASAFGVRLSSRDRLFINDTVTVEVRVPDANGPMVLKGQVVWCRSKDVANYDVGLKLHRVDLMHMQRLYKFVAPDFPE